MGVFLGPGFGFVHGGIPKADVSPQMLTRCLECIGVTTDQVEACSDAVRRMVTVLMDTHNHPEMLQHGTVAWRDGLVEMASVYRRACEIGKGWIPSAVTYGGQRAIDDYYNEAERVRRFLTMMAAEAESEARHAKVPKAIPKPVKEDSARFAFVLIILFGGKDPTLTVDGPFYRLAANLYEAATGAEANLERHCRRQFRQFKHGFSLRPLDPSIDIGSLPANVREVHERALNALPANVREVLERALNACSKPLSKRGRPKK
jgi:hypothetical protein